MGLGISYLVPLTADRFSWWLQPIGPRARGIEIAGTVLVVTLYGLLLWTFWVLF